MRLFLLVLLVISCTYIISEQAIAQGNSAPSMHLNFSFPSSDAILKMQSIRILQSAPASYFEINAFYKGYAGLQQTDDPQYGKFNILLSSMWDPNTAGGDYARVEYVDSTTVFSRFGGEGDGYKTINPYGWQLNRWYTLVNRAWKSEGRLYVGTFIRDDEAGEWLHSATVSISDPGNVYLASYNDAFLENWTGYGVTRDGRHVRQALFRDAWNIAPEGNWERSTRVTCSVNDSEADIKRNGIYHNSFNAYYDSDEGAYCMVHGGSTTPSSEFNGGRTITLPLKEGVPEVPPLSQVPTIVRTMRVEYEEGTERVSWTIDKTTTPQLWCRVDLLDSEGSVIVSMSDTVPHRRSVTFKENLPNGEYSARVIVGNIFNESSQPMEASFIVTGVSAVDEEDQGERGQIEILPNPASDHCVLNVNGLQHLKAATISITNTAGEIVYSGLHNLSEEIVLPVAKLPGGKYYISVQSEGSPLLVRELIRL